MKEEFLKRLKNENYISIKLYKNIKFNYNIIPSNFNLEDYNNYVINNTYKKNKRYFNAILSNYNSKIKLDYDQIKSILEEEDYSLVLSGPGTGKTTSLISKIKYLVDKKKINPKKILVLAYNKNTSKELNDILNLDLNININVKTFNNIGLDIINKLYSDFNPYVVDNNIRDNIFLEWFDNYVYKDKINEFINLFDKEIDIDKITFGTYLKINNYKYKNFNEYFDSYKRMKLGIAKEYGLEKVVKSIIQTDINSENPITINNELVSTKGECIIANTLTMLGIPYTIEKVYNDLSNNSYLNTFVIENNNEKIYIEYFGLSTYSNKQRYEKIKKIKLDYHSKHKLIKVDYLKKEDINNELIGNLLKNKINFNKLTLEEIYYKLLDRNKLCELYKVRNLFYDIIDQIKINNRDNYKNIIINYLNSNKDNITYDFLYKQAEYFESFYKYYNKYLQGKSDYGYDYSDMIYYSNKYINDEIVDFDYVIVDDFQDISDNKINLLKSIIETTNAKLICYGDDYQSIESKNGANIEYILKFINYFDESKVFKFVNDYRNSKEIIYMTNEFILKNNNQIKKNLNTNKSIDNSIIYKLFDDEVEGIKEVIDDICSDNKHHNILILSNKNKYLKDMYLDQDFKDDRGTKVRYKKYKNINIDAMTIDKAKGLTYDDVIVIGLNNFPNVKNNIFWLKNLFVKNTFKENINYAEERRLFYVALTRSNNRVYVLANRDDSKRSKFLTELYLDNNERIGVLE